MIEHHVFIVVADGRRAFIYRNSGTAQSPHLELVSGFEQKNPATHEQGTDKPGTGFASAGGVRSHVSENDYHEAQERAFANDLVHIIVDLKKTKNINALIWVAPPRMLAELRREMPQQLKQVTIKEINKDLTKHTPHDIVKLVSD